jgi:hypothetical protein
MCPRSCLFWFAFVLCTQSVRAQEENTPWLSFERLAVTAGSTYHFVPWKKYNESMSLAQTAISYDPYYQDPGGEFEKIRGDVSFDFALGYRIVGGLSVNLNGGYLATGSLSTVWYYRGTWGWIMSQKVNIDVPYYGIGIQYERDVTQRLSVAASGCISRFPALFSFENRRDWVGQSRIVHTATLRETRYGMMCRCDFLCRAFGPLSVNASVNYRWLKYPNLAGNGTYTYKDEGAPPYSRSYPFGARLGEAQGYFGIILSPEDQAHTNVGVLYDLWERTSAPRVYNNQQPAVLNLSGFGISVGIRYEL